jgi:hypothetical protein
MGVMKVLDAQIYDATRALVGSSTMLYENSSFTNAR